MKYITKLVPINQTTNSNHACCYVWTSRAKTSFQLIIPVGHNVNKNQLQLVYAPKHSSTIASAMQFHVGRRIHYHVLVICNLINVKKKTPLRFNAKIQFGYPRTRVICFRDIYIYMDFHWTMFLHHQHAVNKQVRKSKHSYVYPWISYNHNDYKTWSNWDSLKCKIWILGSPESKGWVKKSEYPKYKSWPEANSKNMDDLYTGINWLFLKKGLPTENRVRNGQW
jgi:hypothetical protein